MLPKELILPSLMIPQVVSKIKQNNVITVTKLKYAGSTTYSTTTGDTNMLGTHEKNP